MPLLSFRVGVRHQPELPHQVVGFGLDDVAPEGRRKRRRIGLHIQHVFEHVPEVSDTRLLEVVQDARDAAPIRDLGVGFGIVLERSENNRRRALSHADGDTCELRHRAEVVIRELHESGGLRIIQRLQGLQRDQNNRDIQITDDHAKGRRSGVSQHIAKDQV